MHSKAENDRLAPTLDFIFAMKVLNGGFIEVFLFVFMHFFSYEDTLSFMQQMPHIN